MKKFIFSLVYFFLFSLLSIIIVLANFGIETNKFNNVNI